MTRFYRPPRPSIWRDVCALLPDVRIADGFAMLSVFALVGLAMRIL
jgi:hypothetical protein